MYGTFSNLAINEAFLKRFYLFLERGRERERERNLSVWLPLVCPLLGTWPTTQACALTGNRTGEPLVLEPALNPLSHTSQGKCIFKSTYFGFFKKNLFILLLDRQEGREKERERNINVWLPLVCPLLGTWPTTQACALTGN